MPTPGKLICHFGNTHGSRSLCDGDRLSSPTYRSPIWVVLLLPALMDPASLHQAVTCEPLRPFPNFHTVSKHCNITVLTLHVYITFDVYCTLSYYLSHVYTAFLSHYEYIISAIVDICMYIAIEHLLFMKRRVKIVSVQPSS